jgi:hypothetical protein
MTSGKLSRCSNRHDLSIFILETARNCVALNVQLDPVTIASEKPRCLTWQLEESSTVGVKHVNIEYCTVCDLFHHFVFLTQHNFSETLSN